MKDKKILKERKKMFRQARRLIYFAGEDWKEYFHSSIVVREDPNVSTRRRICFFDEKYARQVLNIHNLHKYSVKLKKIDASKRVSYFTKIEAFRFVHLVDTALKIYKKGLDTPDFDDDVATLNKFLEKHLVFRVQNGGPRTTFRMFCREDLQRPEFREDGKMKSSNEIIEERKDYFLKMEERFYNHFRQNKQKDEKTL